MICWILRNCAIYNVPRFVCRSGRLLHSFRCFEGCLSDNGYLRSQQNLENVCNALVERWHFRMLNDDIRNDMFQQAIRSELEGAAEDFRVLDIGTGTGLLSLFAAKAGCRKVFACDDSQVMCMIVRHVIQQNNLVDMVRVLQQHSTELKPADIGGLADLIVTETLDSGAFGEGILQTLIHAKQHLLKPNGRILPQRITLRIAGFESNQMALDHICLNDDFTDMIYLKGCKLVSNTAEPYDTENVGMVKDFRIITSHEDAFTCNFNDVDDMRSILKDQKQNLVKLVSHDVGHLDGFVVWFDLDVDSFNPVSSSPTSKSCWDNVIFRLSHRLPITKLFTVLPVKVSSPDGRLTLEHKCDYKGNVLTVDQDVIRFINDFEYIDRLEHEFFSMGKGISSANRAEYGNVLDFSPFPYVAIGLLKERRAKRIFCAEAIKEFVQFVAIQNALLLDDIIFIEDPADVLGMPYMFDVIILSPLNTLGCVNSAHLSNYTHLQTNNLTPGGRMVPHRIEVWGELIQSHYLREVSAVTNPKLDELGIQAAINKFSTLHHMDLQTFPHSSQSAPFLCAELRLNDEYAANTIVVSANSLRMECDGILYYFKIRVAPGTRVLSTRRLTSHIRRASLLWDPNRTARAVKRNPTLMNVHFVQNHGVISFNN